MFGGKTRASETLADRSKILVAAGVVCLGPESASRRQDERCVSAHQIISFRHYQGADKTSVSWRWEHWQWLAAITPSSSCLRRGTRVESVNKDDWHALSSRAKHKDSENSVS